MIRAPLHRLCATELVSLYERGELSPLQYHSHLLDHLQRQEPLINALCLHDPQQVLDQAEQATRRWARRAPCGPLDGVPVTLKALVGTRSDAIAQGCA